MKGELLYAYSPVRWRIMWAIVYAVLLAGALFALYQFGSQIGTHSVPVGDVRLSIPYSKFLVGETVPFTVHNGFNSTIYVTNNCPSEPLEVFKLESGTWKRIHDTVALSDCPLEGRQIAVPANGSMSGTFKEWRHLFNKPGKYRVVAYVEYYNALPYQDFEVISKPKVPRVPVAPAVPTISNILNRNSATSPSSTVSPTVKHPVTNHTDEDRFEPNDD
ncbi:MAG: hypothetical protein H6797_03230 [Candidatus Nomurabacteria bacterium]|nr:MAG: hypothetical protein H6797_03230 [Candidatus Nomurabacteria bacterium]